MRSFEAGWRANAAFGRRGRRTNSPPQLGQVPFNLIFAQSLQNVHSNVQILASVLSLGRSRLQHSQFGRSCSMTFPSTLDLEVVD